MDHDAFVTPFVWHRVFRFYSISIQAMYDFNGMALNNKGARQSTDIGPATSEIVGWVKRRDHAEPHKHLSMRR